MLKKWKSRYLEHRAVASGIVEFICEKPKEFSFQAGQHSILKLPELHYQDVRGPMRPFTIASGPQHPFLSFITRQTGSGFKKTWMEIESGTEIELLGPRGDFNLRDCSHQVFLAGGVGITPFLSMIEAWHEARSGQPITLFYSAREESSMIGSDYFKKCADKFDFFTYIPVITRLAGRKKSRISTELVNRMVKDLSHACFYICGPPAMVDSMRLGIAQLGVSDDRILSESFFGY